MSDPLVDIRDETVKNNELQRKCKRTPTNRDVALHKEISLISIKVPNDKMFYIVVVKRHTLHKLLWM